MRIFFNRGFSLAPIAAAMIRAVPSLEIFIAIGVGKPRLNGATEIWEESEANDEGYLAWLRERIRTYDIDLLIPTRRRALIASAELPCRVQLPSTASVLELLEDKFKVAESVQQESYHLATKSITSAAGLRRALAASEFQAPCIKPRKGVNGLGFWKLRQTSPTAHLDDPHARQIRPDLFIAAIEAQQREGGAPNLILMDYLPGPEVSFDVLSHRGALLKYAARTKLPGGNQRIESYHVLESAVARLVSQFSLTGVTNIQFRRSAKGDWKLLEINARPAGGSVNAESVGAAILGDWARLLAGEITPEQVSRPSIVTEIT